jgi:pimeloyl-ACP methyl ester carboxylesterase
MSERAMATERWDDEDERWADADGCRLRYTVAGDGPPLVLIHGLGGSTVVWSELVPLLADEWRIIAVDLRGCGGTQELAPAELSLDRWARDLASVLDAANGSDAVLVGHSLGVNIALAYARMRPDAVRGLVLLNGEAAIGRFGERLSVTIADIQELGYERWLETRWRANPPLSDASIAAHPELLDRYEAMVAANEPDAYIRVSQAIRNAEDQHEVLALIDIPSVVVAGELDDRMPPAVSRDLANLLSNASYVEIDGTGHVSPFEAPDVVADAIRKLPVR